MAINAKVDSVVEWAGYLQQALLRNQPVSGVSIHLRALPLSHKSLSSSDRIKLKRHGVALWNLCGKLRKTEQLLARKGILSQARAFAFLLLDSAAEEDTGLLKNALHVAYECLDAKVLEPTSRIIERAAVLHETVDAGSIYTREYLLLRLTLAWQQDRPELADHFFAKLQTEAARTTAADALYCADLFLDIGRDHLEKRQNGSAVKWLERAVAMLDDHEIKGPDIANLRFNVLHTYARALLRLEEAGAGLWKAQDVLKTLQRLRGPDNLAVKLINLEPVSEEEPDAQFAAVDALSRLQFTDSTYKAVMLRVNQLRKLDHVKACQALREYLVERLAIHGNGQWIESALITLVSMSTSPECTNETADLEAAFTGLSQTWTTPLSAEAAHGVLVLLWKKIKSTFNSEAFQEAAAWCKLGMHRLLSVIMGDDNIAELRWKLLRCQWSYSEPETICEAALAMSPGAMEASSLLELEWFTRTLFDLALRFHKQWPAQSIIQLLGHVVELPRSLLQKKLSGGEDQPVVERLKRRQAMSLFALAMLYTAEARHALSADVRACENLAFSIESYEKVCNHVRSFDQHIRPPVSQGSCEESNACELAFAQRNRLSIQAQRIALLPIEFEASLHTPDTRSTIQAENHKFETLSNIIASAVTQNAPAKTYAVFIDMVLCVVLEEYDKIEPLISVDRAAKLLRQLIDATRGRGGYSVPQASRAIRCVVQLLINQPEMIPGNRNIEFVEEMVEQAMLLASNGKPRDRETEGADNLDTEVGTEYPVEELEWLATTLFNVAVDFYVSENEEVGRKWARQAVELAELVRNPGAASGDGGALLARVLEGKLGELGWSA